MLFTQYFCHDIGGVNSLLSVRMFVPPVVSVPPMFSRMRLFPGIVPSFRNLMGSLYGDRVGGYRVLRGELPSVWVLLGHILVGRRMNIHG